jgi:hypothetical protein
VSAKPAPLQAVLAPSLYLVTLSRAELGWFAEHILSMVVRSPSGAVTRSSGRNNGTGDQDKD